MQVLDTTRSENQEALRLQLSTCTACIVDILSSDQAEPHTRRVSGRDYIQAAHALAKRTESFNIWPLLLDFPSISRFKLQLVSLDVCKSCWNTVYLVTVSKDNSPSRRVQACSFEIGALSSLWLPMK